MNDDAGVSQQAIIERLNECINLVRSNSKRLEIESTMTNLKPDGEVLPAGFQAGHPNSNEVVDNDKINGILQVLTKIFSKIRKVKVNTYYDGNLKSSETTDKPIINLTVDSPDLIYGKVGGIGENIVVDNQDIEKRLNDIYQIWVSLPPIEQTIDIHTCRTEDNGCKSWKCNSCKRSGTSGRDTYGPDGLTTVGHRCYSRAADRYHRACKDGVHASVCKSNGCHGGKGGSNNGSSCRCRGNGKGGRSGCRCRSCRGSSGGKGGRK